MGGVPAAKNRPSNIPLVGNRRVLGARTAATTAGDTWLRLHRPLNKEEYEWCGFEP